MTIEFDTDQEDADWTKAWDLPPYKSPEFMQQIGGEDKLESFRTLPVYKRAVAAGLIHDDEWMADWVETDGEGSDLG